MLWQTGCPPLLGMFAVPVWAESMQESFSSPTHQTSKFWCRSLAGFCCFGSCALS